MTTYLFRSVRRYFVRSSDGLGAALSDATTGTTMKTLISLILLLASLSANAQTVNPDPVEGIAVPFDVSLPAGGQLRISSLMVDYSKSWAISGSCTKAVISRPPRGSKVTVGWNCTGPSMVHFTSTSALTSYCPGDGEQLVPLHLTMYLDGAVIYDKGLFQTNQVCYVTPAKLAATSFAYPTITFDNSAQNRPSEATTYFLEGYLLNNYPQWSTDGQIVCDRWLRDVDPSIYVIKLEEVGMKCSGIIPANTVWHVNLQ